MTRHLALRIGLGVLAAVLLLLIAISLFDWNHAKPWLNARISEATGRPFAINGDLSLDWQSGDEDASGWRAWVPWPQLTAQDITLGHPEWVDKKEAMAQVGQLRFTLNPLPLLARRIVIPSVQLNETELNVIRAKNGKTNWTFGSDEQQSPWQLDLEELQFRHGSIHLVDAIQQIDATANVDSIAPGAEGPFRTRWTVDGTMQQQEVSGKGRAGGVLALRSQGDPFPLEASLTVGATKLAANGTVTGIPTFAEADLRLDFSGDSMAHLYPLIGVVLPHTPRFSTEGHLLKAGSTWRYENFKGKVGKSDLAGTLTVEMKQPRPFLKGELVSQQLRFEDLGPVVGTGDKKNFAKGDKNEKQPAGKALPVRDFDTRKWQQWDADVRFRGKRIVRTEALPFEDMVAHLTLQNGILSLSPLNFGVAGGKMKSDIRLNGQGEKIQAKLDLSARNLELKRLFPSVESLEASVGDVNGNAKLTATGNSVASLLDSADGEVKAVITRGTVSKLLLETIGLNIGSLVLTKMFGDEQVALNCMASDFNVEDGVMKTQAFVFDTEEAIIRVTGQINLGKEKMDLVIHPENKELRLLSLRSPLYVQGSFSDPEIGVDKGTLAAKAGGALALGLAAPVASALLPLINPGENRDTGCRELLQQASKAPEAPPLGKSKK